MLHKKKASMLGAILLGTLVIGCSRQEVLPVPEVQEPVQEGVVDLEVKQETEESLEPVVVVEDYSQYFAGHEGSAVFYTPSLGEYRIYNEESASERCSPCSTFKIVATLTALENGIISPEDSMRAWSGEYFWNKAWNEDQELEGAFKNSCVWYFRQLINELGPEKMQASVDGLGYGNGDISDWEGVLNKNNSNRALTGFWIESSLQIAPKEQVEVLAKIFE
ncbi:MAG: penicillin-binding transpeptidase domain-containing protein, partial [Cellulosilyticaceae bacterium]